MGEPLAAIFRVTPNKFPPDFDVRKGRRTDVDLEHGAKPQIFANALVDHLLAHAAAPRVVEFRTNG